MTVFVAGATGAIGRPLLQQLLSAGYDVTALARSQDSAERLRANGVDVVVGDVFDRGKVRAALVALKPEVVINQLTSIPHNLNVRNIAQQFELTNRLRIEGSEILMEAALAAGAGQFVAQSYAPLYTPHGHGPATEEEPLYLDAPPAFSGVVQALGSLERTVLETPGIRGTVLRYGHFYGPGTSYSREGSIAEAVRRRQMPVIGDGKAASSFVHVDDAAAATVLALNEDASGIYNIVDDDPAPVREWLPVYAELLGAPRPWKIPKWLGRLVGGPYAVFFMEEQRGASNRRAKQALGWQPYYASWRDGFRAELS